MSTQHDSCGSIAGQVPGFSLLILVKETAA